MIFLIRVYKDVLFMQNGLSLAETFIVFGSRRIFLKISVNETLQLYFELFRISF